MKEMDMAVPCENGLINIRVGAIIMRDDHFLMVGNNRHPEYLYSVGGRVKFGETAEEAIIREVYEETGVKMEIDRLGFVHENYFYGDSDNNLGILIYEVSFYFYMKVPEHFEAVCHSVSGDEHPEFLQWVTTDSEIKYYPEFFRTELKNPKKSVKFFSTDER